MTTDHATTRPNLPTKDGDGRGPDGTPVDSLPLGSHSSTTRFFFGRGT